MPTGAPQPQKEEGPVHIPKGKIVGRKWKVVKKLGAGGCGAVYMVEKVDEPGEMAALKAESNFAQGGSVLKIEVDILRRLAGKAHVAQYKDSGKRDRFQYVVMTLLGESLSHLLRKLHKCSVSTQIRVGVHILHGLKHVHDIGFVHRDIKPANLALGHVGSPEARFIHILDFGLSREFIVTDSVTGETRMRRPRKRALFRGTTRYCSIGTHDRIEQGRVDDLWSLLYVMVECRGSLPWSTIRSKEEVAECKRRTTDQELLAKSPVQLLDFAKHLRTLTYYNRPDYKMLYTLLTDIINDANIKMNDPWDWEKGFSFLKRFSGSSQQGQVDQTTTSPGVSDVGSIGAEKKEDATMADEDQEKEKESNAFHFNEEEFDRNPFGF